MNISRIALLSAVFFAAPVFSMDTTPAPTFLSQAANVVTAPIYFVVNHTLSTADFIASWTVNPILNKIASITPQDGIFATNTGTIGRAMVLTTAAYLAYQAYNACNGQDVDSSEDIFGDDEYAAEQN